MIDTKYRTQGLLAIFSALQVINVVRSSNSTFQTKTSLPAAIMTLCAALGLCVLSHFEHIKSIRPSSIINAYLLFTIPLDGITLRTHFLRSEDQISRAILTAILAVKIIVLTTEATEKRRILLFTAAEENPSPEATSGMLAQWVFWWLNSLFWLGSKGDIRDEDLLVLDKEMLSESLTDRFSKFWSNRMSFLFQQLFLGAFVALWLMSRA